MRRGALVGQKFRVVAKLGQGGMGTVYEGEHTELGHRVAIKVILGGAGGDEMVKRFHREAIVLGQLESDHVVRVFDCGVLPGGAPYLVMEFLKGMDLEAYLRSKGPLPVEEAAEIGISVCDALADAHSKGIVHRDIKPSNLFLVDRPGRRIIKVLDFGVSLLRRPGDESLTQAHAVLGTPLYAAPEQLTASKGADGRADLWSLGASLFELVTGEVPFPAATLSELAVRLQKPPRLASEVNPKVSPAFAKVLAGCMQRDLTERYASAPELRRALKPFRALSRSSSVFGAALSEEEREAFSQAAPQFLPRATPQAPIPAEETEVTEAPYGARPLTPQMAPPSPLAAATIVSSPPASRMWLGIVGALTALVLLSAAGIVVFRKRSPADEAWRALSTVATAVTTETGDAAGPVIAPPAPSPPPSAPTLPTALPSASASAPPTVPVASTAKLPKPRPTFVPAVPTAPPTKPLMAPGER